MELTDNMVRAIAKQAEAERDRRAKIIHADAEFQASQTLVNAAKILGSVPAAMQLRYLQTLTEIGAEQNSTVVFPMPIDIIKPSIPILDQVTKAPIAIVTAQCTGRISRVRRRATDGDCSLADKLTVQLEFGIPVVISVTDSKALLPITGHGFRTDSNVTKPG